MASEQPERPGQLCRCPAIRQVHYFSPDFCSPRPAAPSEPPAADSPTPVTCRCRNLADEHMPPSERIGDTEAQRRGLWSVVDCPVHTAPSPVDTTEPPAETQQDGLAVDVTAQWLWEHDHRQQPGHGLPHFGSSDEHRVEYLEAARDLLDREEFAALASRPSADTETLLPVRAEIIRQVREAAWAEGYEACYRGQQRHNPYCAALDAR